MSKFPPMVVLENQHGDVNRHLVSFHSAWVKMQPEESKLYLLKVQKAVSELFKTFNMPPQNYKSLNSLAQEVHLNAKAKGFWEDRKPNIAEKIALIHSEVSEMLDADRHGKFAGNEFEEYERDVKGSFEEEIADTIIRCLDLACFLGIDIEKHIEAKMIYNSLRTYKHGKRY